MCACEVKDKFRNCCNIRTIVNVVVLNQLSFPNKISYFCLKRKTSSAHFILRNLFYDSFFFELRISHRFNGLILATVHVNLFISHEQIDLWFIWKYVRTNYSSQLIIKEFECVKRSDTKKNRIQKIWNSITVNKFPLANCSLRDTNQTQIHLPVEFVNYNISCSTRKNICSLKSSSSSV